VRLRIDIPLLFLPLLPQSSFRGAQEPWARSPRHDGTPNGARPIMLRPGQEAGNRPGGATANRDPTVTGPLSVRYPTPPDADNDHTCQPSKRSLIAYDH